MTPVKPVPSDELRDAHGEVKESQRELDEALDVLLARLGEVRGRLDEGAHVVEAIFGRIRENPVTLVAASLLFGVAVTLLAHGPRKGEPDSESTRGAS